MKAVQFGAGNIGRGFIGQLFARSGLEVVFVEADRGIVEAMNLRRRYPVRVVSDSGDSESYVEGVRAISAFDVEAVARELAGTDVVGTAVGAAVLPRIAPLIAAGLSRRWGSGNESPLDIIICENLAEADEALRSLVAAGLAAGERNRLTRLVGFVRASVGRMVPAMTDGMREGDPLRIWVEAYDRLLVDARARVGDLGISNVESVPDFEFYLHRKLYVHNLGHAAVAYLGALRGYGLVWEAVGDREVARAAGEAMLQSARAVALEHRVEPGPIEEHVEELLGRFANRKLGDTVARVGRDLPRKLAPRDRVLGAVGLCARHGLARDRLLDVLAAALRFEDPASTAIRDALAATGPYGVLRALCGMVPGDPDMEYVVARYSALTPALGPRAGGA